MKKVYYLPIIAIALCGGSLHYFLDNEKSSILFITTLCVFSLILVTKFKRLLYTITPEQQHKKALNTFDANKKALDDLDINENYNLGNNHIY